MRDRKISGASTEATSTKPPEGATGIAASQRRRAYPIAIAVLIILVVVVSLWAVKGLADDGQSLQGDISATSTGADPLASASSDIWSLDARSVDMEAIVQANVPAIVDFGSDSCVPCKQMAPVLKRSNEKMQGRAIIKFVDVWKYTDAANGFPVQVIPTQVLMMPGGAPYVPREGLYAELGLEFVEYENASGQHTFTTHQGALTQEQMDAILEDVGV